jgi:hypothetical protein
MNWTPKDFKKYCSSKAYHDDFDKACPTTLKPSQRAVNGIPQSLKIILTTLSMNMMFPRIGERAPVCQKLQFLYDVLEDCLNTDQVKPLTHTYGENYSINTVYHEMKKQTLALTKDQLSYDTLLQYIEAIQIPGKWSGTLFNVVLHWYVQIKAYMWLELIGLLPMKTLCSMQSAIEDVILLEYKWQIDHGEHTDSSTLHRCLSL